MSPPVAFIVHTDVMKSSPRQPSCLMMRSNSSFNSSNHESAIIDSSWSGALGSTADRHVWSTTETYEHEHTVSSVAATGLQPSRGVSQEGWQCETEEHRVHPVSRTISQRRQPSALSGALSRVAISTLATAAAMSRGLVSGTENTLTTNVHQSLDWTGLPTVAGSHLGVQFSGSDTN